MADHPGHEQHRDREWLVTYPLSEHDSTAVAALRPAVAPAKGVFDGIAGRERYDAFMQSVSPPPDVTFEAATIGGVRGWWVRTPSGQKDAAIMYMHGGWFTWGSAAAFRSVAGHIASRAGTDTFVPDYRLAPEHPFPAAVRDLEACHHALREAGKEKIALVGDSAGGNLALVLLLISVMEARQNSARPLGAVVFSPITDLALTGESYASRADADLYFTKSEAAILARNYLGEANPTSFIASPLYADLTKLPPIRVHVGDAEVLLDDSRRFVEKAWAAGVDARLAVWSGMPHGFPLNIGMFDAGAKALESSGAFLAEILN